jgi:hypothetical protein
LENIIIFNTIFINITTRSHTNSKPPNNSNPTFKMLANILSIFTLATAATAVTGMPKPQPQLISFRYN